MKLVDFFCNLVKSKGEEEPGEAVEYKGYTIRPAPKRENGRFYTAGIISKSFPEGVKEHRFIRADIHPSREGASEQAISKAQRIIDERGDQLFTE
jgi:hypothetical protein